MSDTTVPTIRCLGIDPIQLPHSFREVPVSCLNHQVVVITHPTLGIASPVELCERLFEDLQELFPVLITFRDGFPTVPSRGDAIERAIQFDSYGPCHALAHTRLDASFVDSGLPAVTRVFRCGSFSGQTPLECLSFWRQVRTQPLKAIVQARPDENMTPPGRTPDLPETETSFLLIAMRNSRQCGDRGPTGG